MLGEPAVIEIRAEAVTRAGQDDDLVLHVLGNVREGRREVPVRDGVEDEGAAVGVQRQLQHPILTLEAEALVLVRVVIEFRQTQAPLVGRAGAGRPLVSVSSAVLGGSRGVVQG